MMKFLISIYIAAVLLFAGLAKAENNLSFSRIQNATQIDLKVSSIQVDPNQEILKISGPISQECFKNIKPVMRFDRQTNEIYVAIRANQAACDANHALKGNYDVVVDLRAFFAENPVNQNTMIRFVVDNYNGDLYSFNYLAQKFMPYSFDQSITGKIEIDPNTQQLVIQNQNQRIPLLSRFDLEKYVHKTVLLKGMVPSSFSIGNEPAPTTGFVVGQLIALE